MPRNRIRATGGIPDLNCKDQLARDVLDGGEATRNGKAILLVG